MGEILYVCCTPVGGPAIVVAVTLVMPIVRNACFVDAVFSLIAGSSTENLVVPLSGTCAMTTLTSVPMPMSTDVMSLPEKLSVCRPFLYENRGVPLMLVVE